MIKIGNTVVGLQDPDGKIDQIVQRFHSTELARYFCPSVTTVCQRGSNLLYTNYPELPAPKINQIVVPTGATRWSYGLFLANTSMKNAILAEGNQSGNGLRVQFSTEDSFRPEVEPLGGRPAISFSLYLYPLNARPLSPRFDVGDVSGNAVQDLWLIPMVDRRYWWQFKTVGSLSSEAIADSSELFAYFEQVSECFFKIVGLSTAYADYLPDILAENDHENLALAIESTCWHYGLQLVPELNSTSDSPRVAVDGRQFGLISASDSPDYYDNNMKGYIGLDVSSTGSGGSSGNVGFEFVGAPSVVMGGEFTDAGRQLPAAVKIQSGTNVSSETADSLEIDSKLVLPDTEVVLRLKYKDNSTIPSELARQIASDYYDRFSKFYDWTFAGIQPFQPTALDDCIIFSQVRSPSGNGYICQTRVRSWPGNLMPEVPSAAVSSSSSGSAGCPCVCLDAGNLTVDGIETTSQWSVALSAQKFKQTYGIITLPAGSYIVVWDSGSSLWTLDVSASLTAAYLDGSDATADTTMDGTLTLEWAGVGSAPSLKLCVDGTIPAP